MNTSELEARCPIREFLYRYSGLQGAKEAAKSLSTLRQRIEALEAENGRLREALKPFADTGELIDLETTGFADEDVLDLIIPGEYLLERIAVGCFRTARQALGEG